MIPTKVDYIKSGKYTFKITRNILSYDNRIISHTYKIGGDTYDSCVNISYQYSKDNIPISVSIPHLLYEPECSVETNLEKGGGTEIMINTILEYAYNDVKTLPIFYFDDMSHIDCIEKDVKLQPPRKLIMPVNLAFFYIAYHGKTWYEARFNAEMKNKEKYKKYRNSLTFLTNPDDKLSYADFLQLIKLSSNDEIEYLKGIYESSATYRDFFEKIPKDKRCKILYQWLNTFMKKYLTPDVYSNEDWEIDIRKINKSKGGRRHYRRKNKKDNIRYYIFDYKIKHSL